MSALHPCCKHCPEDPVHDVPKDQHDGPCDTCRIDAHLRRVAESRAEVDHAERDRLVEMLRLRSEALSRTVARAEAAEADLAAVRKVLFEDAALDHDDRLRKAAALLDALVERGES